MEIPETRICPMCGGENEQRAACTFCGARLEMEGAPPALPPQGAAPAAPVPEAVQGFSGAAGPFPPQAPIQAAPAPRYAGFWIRLCAYISDAIVIQVIIWLLVSVAILGYTLGVSGAMSAGAFQEIYQAQWGSIASLDILVKLIYYTLFLGRSGQTPGKKLFGLRVIRTDGGPVTHGQALIRTIGYYINLLTLEIGFLWVAVDRRKQGLHDKIAGTLEIRE